MKGLVRMSKNEKLQYELVNYFDVWGNNVDGWEVNNLCVEGIVELKDNATNKDIIQAIVEFGFFKPSVTEKDVDIWDDGDMIEFHQSTNQCPICRLQIVRQ